MTLGVLCSGHLGLQVLKQLVAEYTKVLETIIVSDSLEKISNFVIE